MNLRSIYNEISETKPKSILEAFALLTMLELFPEKELDDSFSRLEREASSSTFAILVPDIDFDDSSDYADYLEDQEWGDDGQRRVAERTFDRISQAAIVSGIYHPNR